MKVVFSTLPAMAAEPGAAEAAKESSSGPKTDLQPGAIRDLGTEGELAAVRPKELRSVPGHDLPLDEIHVPHEIRHEEIFGVLIDFPGFPDLSDDSGFHDSDPVGNDEGLFLVVSDVKRGDSKLSLNVPDLFPHLNPELRVEIRERFVRGGEPGVR